MKEWKQSMTLSNSQDDFEPDDFEADVQDDFVADDFEPDEPKKEKSWYKDTPLDIEFNPFKADQSQKAREVRNVPKAVASGATAGFSELVPGLEVEDLPGSNALKITGSLIPFTAASKAFGVPLRAAAAAAPVKYAPYIESFGHLIGLSATGGLYEGLEESAEKTKEAGEFVPPSLDTIKEQGAKWAAIDIALRALGWGGRFAKGLLEGSSKFGLPPNEMLELVTGQIKGTEKVAEQALAILEGKSLKQIEAEEFNRLVTKDVSPQAVEEQVQQATIDLRDKKISQKQLDRIGAESQVKIEPYLPAEFEAESISEDIMSNDLTNKIESTAQRAPSELELGKNVQADIESSVKKAKAETDALYETAKAVEKESFPTLQKTADSIVEQINKIKGGGIKLSPEGYKKAETQLMTTLTDLGYGVEMDEAGNIIKAVENQRQPLSKVVDVKRRLNNIVNYDLLDTSAQDFLKAPAHELRGEIRNGYGSKDSPARKAFEEAEKKFGEFAEKKGKKSIRNMRMSEKPESIAKTISTPSGLADVKDVLSPEQFAQVERELLERMKGMDETKAANFYREMRPSMSGDTRAIAEEIIQAKAPKNSPTRKVAQREAIQKKAIDDIAKATITGERPDVALNLWKTTEGQQLIKNALENNPNKEAVLKYLEEQSFKDMYSSIVTDDGLINFKKLDAMLADKATAANIKMVAGEDGYNFLKNMEHLSGRVKKNMSVIEGKINKGSAKERAAINKELEKQGQKILDRSKNKNVQKKEAVKERYQGVIEESIGKKSAPNRKAVEKQEARSGERKFEQIKGKRAAEAAEVKSAEEAAEKSKLIYKLDDFLSSYGIKTKGLMAGLGILKLGTVEGITLSLGYEAFSRLAKNKRVQDAFKKAAIPRSSPAALVESISELLEELDQ